MKTREPEGLPPEREEGLLDKGSGERSPSARYLAASEELAIGGAKSRYQALVRAGYSPSTARNPSQNGYQPVEMLQTWQQHAEAQGDSIKALKPLAVRTLRGILEDQEESGQTRAMTATAAIRLGAELDEETAVDLTAADKLFALASLFQAQRVGMKGGAVYGYERAMERLEEAAEARLGAPLDDVLQAARRQRRSTQEGMPLPVRQLHAKER